MLFLLLHGLNRLLLGDGYLFALDHDASVPSWATSALFTLAGAVCALFAWLEPASRRPVAALAVVALGLSMEQVAQLHVEVEEALGDPAETLIEAALAVAIVAAIVLAARTLPAPFGLLLLASIAALVLSALASQMNQAVELPHAGVVFFQAVEEIAEMLTATLILAGLAEPLVGAVEDRLRPPGAASEPRRRRAPAGATPPPAR